LISPSFFEMRANPARGRIADRSRGQKPIRRSVAGISGRDRWKRRGFRAIPLLPPAMDAILLESSIFLAGATDRPTDSKVERVATVVIIGLADRSVVHLCLFTRQDVRWLVTRPVSRGGEPVRRVAIVNLLWPNRSCDPRLKPLKPATRFQPLRPSRESWITENRSCDSARWIAR